MTKNDATSEPAPKKRFRLEKIEERIAPRRFRMVKLEERIAPSGTSSGDYTIGGHYNPRSMLVGTGASGGY